MLYFIVTYLTVTGEYFLLDPAFGSGQGKCDSWMLVLVCLRAVKFEQNACRGSHTVFIPSLSGVSGFCCQKSHSFYECVSSLNDIHNCSRILMSSLYLFCANENIGYLLRCMYLRKVPKYG